VKQIERWSLVAAGCGTVNLASMKALARADVAAAFDTVGLIDPAVIRDVNAHTCPEYAGYTGKYKVARLAELLREWCGRWNVTLFAEDVEDVDWKRLLRQPEAESESPRPTIVLIGLDDWQSRLHVIEDLRHAAPGSPDVVPVQIAVERDQAQVTVFGNRWLDACPACGLLELPASEPCALFSSEGRLVRGDLQREALQAAELVAEIVAELLAPGRLGVWVGTKTNLHATPGGRRFTRHVRQRTHVDGCLGPHGTATPMRLEDLFREEDHRHVSNV